MFVASLLALALSADPQASQETASQEKVSTSPAEAPAAEKPRDPKELRDAVRLALRSTARSWKSAPEDAARELLPLFVELKLDTKMFESDRDRYTIVVRNRLKKIGGLLAAQRKSDAAEAEITNEDGADSAATSSGSSSSTSASSASTSATAGAAGGGAQRDNGLDLVELIQRTIAPETWDVNGGLGSIMYYEPLRVLVVRQSGEGHEQLGGLLEQLKK